MFFKYCDYLANVCSSEDVISFNTQYHRRKYLEYLKREGSNERDSNSRPLAPHASALPGCATPRRKDGNITQSHPIWQTIYEPQPLFFLPHHCRTVNERLILTLRHFHTDRETMTLTGQGRHHQVGRIHLGRFFLNRFFFFLCCGNR